MKTLWEYAEENSLNEDLKKDSKDEVKEKDRQEILENVSSFTVDTTRDKVAWVLNHFPSARDSDITYS